MNSIRVEEDSIGQVELPTNAIYGINTHRAVHNFPISNVTLSHFPELVRSLAFVKKAAASANRDLGEIDLSIADMIILSCDEIISGKYHEQFIVGMIQGGAGTSTNMNMNEVIANIALQKSGYKYGEYQYLHPNDHVNRSQSTNDVYPTSIRLAILQKCNSLIAEQRRLINAFKDKATDFSDVMKVGRTQLQDAVPISLGSEFAAFATTINEDIERVEQLASLLLEVNLGGTAVGTGINTPKGYAKKAVQYLAEFSGYKFVSAADLIEASSDMGAFVTFSGVLKRIAIKLSKICNDLRLLSSGPRAGIGEIILPPVQAGSSIMPGKVNPVIPEVVNQVAYHVVGNDLAITMASEAGQLQLNAMEPMIAYKLLDSMQVLSNAMATLTDLCITGIKADTQRCDDLLTNSLVLATSLVPKIGYDKAAQIAKKAKENNCSIYETAQTLKILNQNELEKILLNK